MEMNPDEIVLETMNKSFAYEKLARDIEDVKDPDLLREVAKCYIKLYFKQQEVVSKMGAL
jgi:hypothetical protein|tara:strand:+ start:3686 stop:3865 length:180 start_codon:yes stop_codon:yes gene_type:complete